MFNLRSVPRSSSRGSSINAVLPRRKAHPWAWMVGLAVALLMVWGFFGMDHLKIDAQSPASSEAATLIVD